MRRALKWIALGLVLTLVGSWVLFPGIRIFCYAFWDTERVPFTISPETTRITEPLLPDGRVDYAAAINARLSQGVTLDNNAAAAFWQARGSEDLDDWIPDTRAQVEKLWGDAPIPPSEHVFVTVKQFAEELWQRAGRPEEEKRRPAALAEKLKADRERAMQRPWSAEEYPDVAQWLARNDAALGKMAAAMRRPYFYLPIVGKDESFLAGMMVWDVSAFRDYARWLSARTMLRVRQGRVDDAWNDILTIERMARLLPQRNAFIYQLIAWAFSGIASGQCGMALAADGNLSAETTARMLRDIRDLPAYPSLADAIDGSERYLCLDFICAVARYGPEIGITAGVPKDSTKSLVGRARRAAQLASCDWNAMLQDVNGVYDKLTLVFQADARVQRKAREREYLAHLKSLGLDLDGPQSFADSSLLSSRQDKLLKALLSLMLPSHQGILRARDGHEARLRVLTLSLALAGYKADHKAYPAKLAELVPKYIGKLPKDPFTDEDFVYRREGAGYLLYSVGPNEKDDGGRTGEDDPKGDDVAVRVPIPPPKEEKEP